MTKGKVKCLPYQNGTYRPKVRDSVYHPRYGCCRVSSLQGDGLLTLWQLAAKRAEALCDKWDLPNPGRETPGCMCYPNVSPEEVWLLDRPGAAVPIKRVRGERRHFFLNGQKYRRGDFYRVGGRSYRIDTINGDYFTARDVWGESLSFVFTEEAHRKAVTAAQQSGASYVSQVRGLSPLRDN